MTHSRMGPLGLKIKTDAVTKCFCHRCVTSLRGTRTRIHPPQIRWQWQTPEMIPSKTGLLGDRSIKWDFFQKHAWLRGLHRCRANAASPRSELWEFPTDLVARRVCIPSPTSSSCSLPSGRTPPRSRNVLVTCVSFLLPPRRDRFNPEAITNYTTVACEWGSIKDNLNISPHLKKRQHEVLSMSLPLLLF